MHKGQDQVNFVEVYVKGSPGLEVIKFFHAHLS